MKIAIIDDELNARDILIRLIGNIADVEVVGAANSVTMGIELIEAEKPDLVLLDIKMNDGTGFDLLERIESQRFQVIFTTAYDQFAIKAFKYSATDYLLKPIVLGDLELAINRVKLRPGFSKRILKDAYKFNNFKSIYISGISNNKDVTIEDIIYCKSESNYTWFYFKDGSNLLTSKTLKYYQELLPLEIFARCHQSYLVNLNYVDKFFQKTCSLKLMDGTEIPVSRRKKTEVASRLRKI